MTADSGKPPSGGGSNPVLAAGRDGVHAEAVESVRHCRCRASHAAGATGRGGRPARCRGMPFPNPAAMFAALDPVEVERKINELKIIEGWLAMSLNMMQMSIKTMELQKASLEAMRAGHASGVQPPRWRKRLTWPSRSTTDPVRPTRGACSSRSSTRRSPTSARCCRSPTRTRASRSSWRSTRAIACRRSPTATSRSTSRTRSSSISTRPIRRRAGRCSPATRASARWSRRLICEVDNYFVKATDAVIDEAFSTKPEERDPAKLAAAQARRARRVRDVQQGDARRLPRRRAVRRGFRAAIRWWRS